MPTSVVVLSVAVTSAPVGGVPWAVAVFTTSSAVSSAVVITYGLAVHVATPPGPSRVGVQVRPVSLGSVMRTGSRVTLPVLVTVNR